MATDDVRTWINKHLNLRAAKAARIRELRAEMRNDFPSIVSRPRTAVRLIRLTISREFVVPLPFHRPEVIRAKAKKELRFARSEIPRTRHSGNDSYTHCGLDDMHGYAREEAEVYGRKLMRAYHLLTRK